MIVVNLEKERVTLFYDENLGLLSRAKSFNQDELTIESFGSTFNKNRDYEGMFIGNIDTYSVNCARIVEKDLYIPKLIFISS